MVDPERAPKFEKARAVFVTSRDIIENTFSIIASSALSLFFLFLYHLLMTRYLGPQEYSVIGTFTSILLTAILMSSAIFFVISRFIAFHHSRAQYEEINYLVTNALKYIFALGFFIFLCFLIFSDRIALFFNLDDVRPVVMLGFAIWLQLLVPVYESAFKGMGEFHTMSRLRIVENFSRWTIALILAYLAFGITAMVFALGLGTFVALATTYVSIRQLQSRQVLRPNMHEIWAYARPAILIVASIALLLNLDLILVKHYFPPAEAGVYAAASFVAKIPFLISWFASTVLFPRVVALHADGKSSAHLLRDTLKWLSVVVVITTFVNVLFANSLFRAVFGPEYSFGGYVGVYSFAMGLLAIVNMLAIYQLARDRFTLAMIFPWFVLLELTLILWFHASIFQIVIVSVLTSTLLVAITLFILRNELQLEYVFNE